MNFADGDGFLDVIIYIIIMVVGLAASAYRNYIKRKEAEKRKVQDEMYTDFPEMEEERVFGEEFPEEKPEFNPDPFNPILSETPEVTEPKQPIIPGPLIQTTGNESRLDRPVSEVEVQKSLIDIVPDINLEPDTENKVDMSQNLGDDIQSGDLSYSEIQDAELVNQLAQEFNAKKAIIYSEIINRKYN